MVALSCGTAVLHPCYHKCTYYVRAGTPRDVGGREVRGVRRGRRIWIIDVAAQSGNE